MCLEHWIFDFGWILCVPQNIHAYSPDSGVNDSGVKWTIYSPFSVSRLSMLGGRERGEGSTRIASMALSSHSCSCPGKHCTMSIYPFSSTVTIFPISSSCFPFDSHLLCPLTILFTVIPCFNISVLCSHASEPWYYHGHCGHRQRTCWSPQPGSPLAPPSSYAP